MHFAQLISLLEKLILLFAQLISLLEKLILLFAPLFLLLQRFAQRVEALPIQLQSFDDAVVSAAQVHGGDGLVAQHGRQQLGFQGDGQAVPQVHHLQPLALRQRLDQAGNISGSETNAPQHRGG